MGLFSWWNKEKKKDDVDVLLDNFELLAEHNNERLTWGYKTVNGKFVSNSWIKDVQTDFKFERDIYRKEFVLVKPYKNYLTWSQDARVTEIFKKAIAVNEMQQVKAAYGNAEKISAEFKAKAREYEIRKEVSTVDDAYKQYLTLLSLHLSSDEIKLLQPVLKDYDINVARSTDE